MSKYSVISRRSTGPADLKKIQKEFPEGTVYGDVIRLKVFPDLESAQKFSYEYWKTNRIDVFVCKED